MLFRSLKMAFAGVLAVAGFGVPAGAAEGYPVRAIRFIVPYSAGGGTDVVARVYAGEMSKILGQTVFVDNRPGAEGVVGMNALTSSPPDGYTLGLVLEATMALNPNLYKAVQYDPNKDFTPISLVSKAPYVIVVNPASGVKSFADLVARAKRKPGSIDYACGASAAYLAAELVQKTIGISLTRIPYKGSGPAIADVLSNRVSVMVSSPVSVLPLIKSGKLTALAVTGAERAKSLPDVPTIAELGYGSVDVVGWYGVSAPAGTPPDIIDRLTEAVRVAGKTDAVRHALQKAGVDPASSTPGEFKAYIAHELDRWRGVIQQVGLQPE
jgi:tripartite-type tricarboxylate transporter receptor subunit TctC